MIIGSILALCTLLSVPECWELALRVAVPRVYDNACSKGYRKYQWQHVQGYFLVSHVPGGEPTVEFCSFKNTTHRVNGMPVTYEVWSEDGDVLWHAIGNNRTGVFKTKSVMMKIWAEPSYAIGPEPTEDNSLILVLSGYGNSSGSLLRGMVAGQIGCGCQEYGHKSPTRICGQNTVVDTAAVFGQFKARRVR